jgi:NNP family nitrate/nitrite transporter-like MFS transporter
MQVSTRAAGAAPEAQGRLPAFSAYSGPLFFLTSIFLLNFMGRLVQAPLMPTIEKELGISHAEAGSLFFTVSIGYFITLIGSGFVSARIRHKGNIVLSGLAVGTALIVTAAGSGLWGIRAGMLLLGLATGLYLPSGIAALTGFVTQAHWGRAVAVHEVAPNLSYVLAPLFAEAVLLGFSWRAALVILGATAIGAALLFGRFGRVGDFAGEAPNFKSLKALFSVPSFWVMVLLFSLGISASLGIYTMLPLYLVNEHGFDRQFANPIIAFSRVSGIFMAFLGGWLVDRFGPKRTLGFVFLFTGTATLLLGLASSRWIPYLVFLQPMVSVCFFPAGFAALSMVAPPQARNIAVSFTAPVAFLVGGGAMPALIGFCGDHGSFALGVSIAGGMVLTGAIISQFLRVSQRTS